MKNIPQTPPALDELALEAPPIIISPGPEYAPATRKFQGIPGLERTAKGRLLATWYSGGDNEGPLNYVVLARSDDDGKTWADPALIIDPLEGVRAFDPVLWIDPRGRLFLFWAQSSMWWDARGGVWFIRCDQPDSTAGALKWSAPRRICHGIMMNKPTVLADGAWLLPTAVWSFNEHIHPDAIEDRFSNVMVSRDQGETFQLLGRADVPERQCDEHMIVEKRDGSLWMLVRTKYGIGESFSRDGGRTWSPGVRSNIAGPVSRFFIRRLRSGRLLLVNHVDFFKRNNLTALLSDDDGKTWPHRLMLDERDGVSYPDGVETADGKLYLIHDRNRTTDREVLMSVITEHDIVNGRRTSKGSRLKAIISRLGS